MAGANAGVQAAYANQMASFGAQASMLNSQVAGATSMWAAGIGAVGSIMGGGLSNPNLGAGN